MALLQIAEPGRSALPHQHRLAVGIDLGTTNSLVAAVRSGSAEILPDGDGQCLLPSVVRYKSDGEIVVGHDARAAAAEDSANVIVSVKRLMGRGMDDLPENVRRAYDFVAEPGLAKIRTVTGVKTPIEVSAAILRSLRERAESALGGELIGAVITVPAYFDDAQRQATKDAARLAGLNVLRLLNEPTAAAIAYGLDNDSEGVFAVYDLGGGTFDVSILRLSRGVFEVLATSGDSALGGDDFDQRIVQWVIQRSSLTDADLTGSARRSLLTAARNAKEALTDAEEVPIALSPLPGRDIKLFLSRALFDELTSDLVIKTLHPVQRAIRDAHVSIADIKGVVMVGGATRMPSVQRAVEGFFGQHPLCNLDPDKVVALGAAMQANVLAGNRGDDDWLLLDVIPLSLGIETMGGLVEKIVPRNATLPIARAQDFTTFRDGQTAMSMHIVQGERELVADCRSLAHFELRGIPPMAAGAARIRVTFQIDADGLLSVSASEQSSGVATQVLVKPSYGLTDDSIARMLVESYENARLDAQRRELREQQIEAQRIIEATEAALAADGEALLSEDEREHIESALLTLRAAARGEDAAAIRSAAEQLNSLSMTFAGRRMDAAIQSALSGRTLAEL